MAIEIDTTMAVAPGAASCIGQATAARSGRMTVALVDRGEDAVGLRTATSIPAVAEPSRNRPESEADAL